jgi:type IV secretion system protein VirB6
MAFSLFAGLFTKVDTATAKFVTQVSSNAIAAVTPYVTAGLALSFVAQGIGIMQGAIETPLIDFVKRMFYVSIIIGIGLAGGLYQSDLLSYIRDLPDALATSLISGDPATTASNLLDTSAQAGFDVASKAADQGGFLSTAGIMQYLIAIVVLFATAVLVALGGAILMMVKVAVALLAAVGPLFIMAMLFEPTKRLFQSWVGQVLSYTLLITLFAAAFGFLMSIFRDFSKDVKVDGSANLMYSVGGMLILAVALLYVLWHLPKMANSLSGGITFDLPERGRRNAPQQDRPADNGQGNDKGNGNQQPQAGQAAGGNASSAGGAPQARGYANGASNTAQQRKAG